MSDSKVSDLAAAAALDGTELLYTSQSSADKKLTAAQVKTFTSASPTLVTPALGTPGSGTLTNCTLPVGGVTGLGTGVATFLATPSSANLAAALTDETGTGANVFANTPTLVSPLLGTPTSGVLTNCTGTAAGLTAGTVTTNANLTGDITSTGNTTTLVITSGTWTPIDSSGAALSLTGASGTYMQIGKMMFITGEFVYPITADVSTAIIGGLPTAAIAINFELASNKGMTGAGTYAAPAVIASTTTIQFSASNNKDVFNTNVNISASSWRISGFYLIP